MILRNMTEHSSRLVQQAILVSEELIRVAILWHEQWHEGLEDASRSLSLYLCYSGLYLRIMLVYIADIVGGLYLEIELHCWCALFRDELQHFGGLYLENCGWATHLTLHI